MSLTAPKISILMSVRDGAAYLPAAIESILGQIFSDFELIAIDDGSQDSTREILDQVADPRLVRLFNPRPLGLAASLNLGLAIAHGKYIARQDADDVSYPDRLRLQAEFLDRHPDVVLLGSAYDVIDANGLLIETQRQPEDDLAIRWQMLFHNAFCHSSVMIRRQAQADDTLCYDASLGFAQDYELWSRLLTLGKAANISTPLLSLRLHPASLSGADKPSQQAVADRVAGRNIQDLLGIKIDSDDVRRLRLCYYTLPASEAENADVLLPIYLKLGQAFALLNPGAQVPRAAPRFWIERFLLSKQAPNCRLIARAFGIAPLETGRAILKRLLGRRDRL